MLLGRCSHGLTKALGASSSRTECRLVYCSWQVTTDTRWIIQEALLTFHNVWLYTHIHTLCSAIQVFRAKSPSYWKFCNYQHLTGMNLTNARICLDFIFCSQLMGSCRRLVALLPSSVWIVAVCDRCECTVLSKMEWKQMKYIQHTTE